MEVFLTDDVRVYGSAYKKGVAEVREADIIHLKAMGVIKEPKSGPSVSRSDDKQGVGVEALKMVELRKIAKDRDIKVPFGVKKAELIELLSA